MAERSADARPAPADAHAPARPPGEWPLPTSIAALRRLWRTLPAPPLEAALGDLDARFTGPRWLRTLAPRGLALLGLPGWCGKRFAERDGALEGTNRTAVGDRLAMQARVAPSAIDGRPALVVTYSAGSSLPWRRVRDELRELPDGRLLAMSLLDAPGPAVPLPFLLSRRSRSPGA